MDTLTAEVIRSICLNGIILGFVKARSDVPIVTRIEGNTIHLDNGQEFTFTVDMKA